MESTTEIENKATEIKTNKKKFALTPVTTALIAGIMIAGTLGFFYRGVFVAAIVDGTPIYRLSVMKDLEKQGGREALDALITDLLLKKEFDAKGVVVPEGVVDTEIKKIEEEISGQGGTLEAALAQQGMTMEMLKEQIAMQKKLEIVLADKMTVTEEELQAHIEESEAVIPEGPEGETMLSQIKDELKQEKYQTEAQTYVADLKTKATITRYVNY